MPPYRLIIFDLDGTLANTLDDIYGAWRFACRQLGLPVLPREKMVQFIGPAREVYLPGILGPHLAQHGDQALQLYTDYYSRHCTEQTRLYPGIRELLAALAPQARLAVASNKPSPQGQSILQNLGVASFFSQIMGPDLAPGKPSPDMFWALVEKAGCKRAETLAIGDTDFDLRAAKAAGVDSAAVLWGFGEETRLRAGQPKYIFRTAAAAAEIILSAC